MCVQSVSLCVCVCVYVTLLYKCGMKRTSREVLKDGRHNHFQRAALSEPQRTALDWFLLDFAKVAWLPPFSQGQKYVSHFLHYGEESRAAFTTLLLSWVEADTETHALRRVDLFTTICLCCNYVDIFYPYYYVTSNGWQQHSVEY